MDADGLMERFCREVAANKEPFYVRRDPGDFAAGKEILEAPVGERVRLLRCAMGLAPGMGKEGRSKWSAVLPWATSCMTAGEGFRRMMMRGLMTKLLRAKLALEAGDVEGLLELGAKGQWPGEYVSLAAVLRAVEQYREERELTERQRELLGELRAKIDGHLARPMATERKEFEGYRGRIEILLGASVEEVQRAEKLETLEPWAGVAWREIEGLGAAERRAWEGLLGHLQTAEGAKPTKKWLAEAKKRVERFGRERFRGFLVEWFPLTRGVRSDLAYTEQQFVPDPNQLFAKSSEATLKGMAWAGSMFEDSEVATALGDLGETCWRKVPNFGPRSRLVGNAVLWALSAIGTNDAVGQLTRINSKLKHSSARALADRAMERVADSTGQTREDLEDLGVPTFALDGAGKGVWALGDFTVTLAMTGGMEVEVTIVDGAGKVRKTVPAEVRQEHGSAWKAVQRVKKEMEGGTPAQRARVESLLRNAERSWGFEEWKKRYLEHPVLGHLAGRLIWVFAEGEEKVAAMPVGGRFVRADGKKVTPGAGARVRLWHPCRATTEEVRAWRGFLQKEEITQPFKQAHREIYLLTEAERGTETYSNRFAAHIIRQHAFAALCGARGWKYRLQGAFDGANVPTLELPGHGMKVEFWVEQAQGVGDQGLTGAGISLHLATDQVRFYRWRPEKISVREANRRFLENLVRARERGEPLAVAAPDVTLMRLEEVEGQLFSEVMRDVDLFVGVCSVGNDPTWNDGGPGGVHRDYWQEFSFGKLNATAETRREILQGLVPRLAIGGQCEVGSRYLTVRGKLRTYKIHLGSGNILMEPNDQYLCIVAAPRAEGRYFLPFEGDHLLAVILSKAFLLAGDEGISDETILRQIRR
ncbi:MAG: DUF4132 domain-containing protein [Phycisphaerae bacterium]